jgi:hypothetical protein
MQIEIRPLRPDDDRAALYLIGQTLNICTTLGATYLMFQVIPS